MHEGSLIAGRYQLVSQIGEGGVATVYRALDQSLDREVAVKILRPDMAANDEVLTRFRREAHAAAKLAHPNVVQIFDTGAEGGLYYIVMEYLPEPDLKRIIKEYAPLPLRKVLEVSIQCARALAYAHRQGLVHRDVKPHNILFTDDGRVKLSDYGIAAAVGEQGLTESGLVLGSAYYISPEQAQGSAATAQSDIYSLGVVMYECITGRPPFTGSSPAEIAARHVRERPPSLRSLNPNITPSAEFVINKAMARELTRRYRTVDELLVDLEKLADGIELDRTGVLGVPGEEATMRLAPQAAAPTSPPASTPVIPAPRPPVPQAGSAVSAPRQPERSPGGMAAATGLAVVIAIVALLGVGWLVKQAFYPGQGPKKVQAPSVKGLSLEEAKRVLTEAGLTLGKVSYEEDASAPDGTVIEQTPSVDQPLPAGTAIALTVKRGKQTVTVPNVKERTVAEATERLQKAGLQVGEVQRIFHETVPAGLVVKQNITGGTKVEAGTSVDLTVSKGPENLNAPEATNDTQGNHDTVADDPVVDVRLDDTYQSDNPTERRFVVKISAMGKERAQRIQIIKSDDTGRGVIEVSTTMNPGASREWPVKVSGNATIEVYHNNNCVFTEPYPAATPGG